MSKVEPKNIRDVNKSKSVEVNISAANFANDKAFLTGEVRSSRRSDAPRKMSETKFKSSDLEHIQKRNETYDTYLSTYVSNFNLKAKVQRRMKMWFFIIVMFSLVLIIGASVFAVCRIVTKNLLEVTDVAAVITAIVGMVSSFLVLPKVIGDNLFPVKEEDQTNEMFGRMVEYDMKLREHYDQVQATEKPAEQISDEL